jgi:hypothetical protein
MEKQAAIWLSSFPQKSASVYWTAERNWQNGSVHIVPNAFVKELHTSLALLSLIAHKIHYFIHKFTVAKLVVFIETIIFIVKFKYKWIVLAKCGTLSNAV